MMKPELEALFEPEEEFLLCTARTRATTESHSRMEQLLGSGLDWDRLVAKANVHGVVPLLSRHLKGAAPGAIPEHVRARVEQIGRTMAVRSLGLNAEFERLVTLLSDRSISVLPLKGPVLAQSVYGTVGLRVFSDLDLLVHPRDFQAVKDLLIAQGYRPCRNLSRSEEAAYLEYEKSYEFVRGRIVVEVHWSLLHARHTFVPDTEEMWARARFADFGNTPVLTLPLEDLLHYLCAHGASHYWTRLKWICDVAELLRAAHKDFDWRYILEQAERLNGVRMLQLGLLLAVELLGAPLPEEIERGARRDRHVMRLVRLAPQWLFRPPKGPQWSLLRAYFDFVLRERVRDRMRYLGEFAVRAAEPSQKEKALVRLPGRAHALYYVIRPFRVIADLIGNRS